MAKRILDHIPENLRADFAKEILEDSFLISAQQLQEAYEKRQNNLSDKDVEEAIKKWAGKESKKYLIRLVRLCVI